uniref:Kinesin-like protein n=1 Tax=Romanomermis culicivorax TaxID=13658 RepID=A0A915I7P9_ROMCU
MRDESSSRNFKRNSLISTNKLHGTVHGDRVFEAERTNMEVYQETAKPIVRSAMLGFNGTIFAYGQTSSGKTYTIMGKTDSWGVIPLSIGEIFETIENTPNRIFLLRVSYMEIYNENVTDLLSGQSRLKIHENQNGDVFVGDLAEEIVRDPETIYALLQKGEARRHVGETNMNDKSSRSHTIFRIIIESRELNSGDMENAIPEASDSCDNIVTVSHLNIVDLAGSERAAQTGATGDRLKEGCAINKSLFTLAQVISKLSDNAGQTGQSSSTLAGSVSDNPQFVNFRDSKLTRILQNSLGGNSKTAIICTVTPASLDETLSTLKFANRAKDIKNKPVKNEVGSDEAMLRRYQKQINELKKQINDLSGSSNLQALQIEKDNLAKQLTEKEEKISQLMHLICISSKIVLSPAQKGNREV